MEIKNPLRQFTKIVAMGIVLLVATLMMLTITTPNWTLWFASIVQQILDTPIIAGFIPAFIGSAVTYNREFRGHSGVYDIFPYYAEVDYSSIESGAHEETVEFKAKNDGWIKKIEVNIWQETKLAGADVRSFHFVASRIDSLVWDGGTSNVTYGQAMLETITAGEARAITTGFPATAIRHESSIASVGESNIKQTLKPSQKGEYFESGQDIRVANWYLKEGGTLTAGNIHLEMAIFFEIACKHGRSSPRQSSNPYVHIMGTFPSSAPSTIYWAPPVDCRIGNMRLVTTAWQGLTDPVYITVGLNPGKYEPTVDSVGHFQGEHMIYMGMDPGLKTAGQLGQTEIMQTAYARGPFYVNKNEPVGIRTNTTSDWFYLTFQFIPDFQNMVQYNAQVEYADIADSNQFYAMVHVDFDMYIEYIEITGGATPNTATIQDTMYILGVKSSSLVGSLDSFLENWSSANIEGQFLGATRQSGPGMNNTLEVIQLAGTVQTTEGGIPISFEKMTRVTDYYEKGSIIGLYLPDDFSFNNWTEFDLNIMVYGKSAVKNQDLGYNVLEGSVLRWEEMDRG